MTKTVLFAEDEAGMRELVCDFLRAGGYEVLLAKDGKEAYESFVANENIDLVISDIMMPHMDGYELLKKIRETSNVPVIMLTAKTGEYDELRGFDVGADEYIKKPFKPKILVARVNALLRRSSKDGQAKTYEYKGIMLNEATHEAFVDNEQISLTGKEFQLLSYFIINKGIALSRDSILENVWDFEYMGDERTVDTHVKKLRSKLGDKGDLIKTVWAFGYKFE